MKFLRNLIFQKTFRCMYIINYIIMHAEHLLLKLLESYMWTMMTSTLFVLVITSIDYKYIYIYINIYIYSITIYKQIILNTFTNNIILTRVLQTY